MAYTNIDDPSAYFTTTLWTGAGGSPRAITNDANSGDFQPDFIWTKGRNEAYEHQLYDSSRGAGTTKGLTSNDTNAEGHYSATYGYMSSIDSNGFTGTAGTSGQNAYFDTNAKTYVAWQWKANGGTTTSVSASGTGSGCVNACTHQANTTAGFSIITYTGRDDQLNNGQHSLLKHGLGVAPTLIILKRRDASADWYVMGKHVTSASAYSNNEYLSLNDSDAINGNSYTGSIAPTSTDIYLGNELVNVASATYIMYAFTDVQSYSKFGQYVGNGNADGTFVYTGFKPACVITKEKSASGGNWRIFDNKRAGYNDDNYRLTPNEASAESTAVHLDLLSNGFKFRNTGTSYNGSGDSYIFMAFSENPFVTSTGIPTTAR